jgi:tetratricopeptide (TPR) repeat protein
MSTHLPKPNCFLVMPFGKKAPPGKDSPVVDFDQIGQQFTQAVGSEELDVVRADFEPAGGFIHRQMFERLLVAEYVVADLTFANPNVMYEVGVRHGSTGLTTILVCAGEFIGELPFDVRPFRIIPYHLDGDWRLTGTAAQRLTQALRERLQLARAGDLPVDNPIMQVTGWNPAADVHHQKTDIFLQRVEYATNMGKRITSALAATDAGSAADALAALEDELLSAPEVVSQLHSTLLGVYLGYREVKAYDRMAQLFERLPRELQQTPVALEQLALALNRLAEQSEKEGDRPAADGYRSRALAVIDDMPPKSITSETYGIRGRIYKGWYDSEMTSGSKAKARGMLKRAVETYERGLRADARDYYPGVNTVTLRLMRGTREDLAAVARLAPVVRFAVECAPEPKNEQERYWQTATRLELAGAARDWEAADGHLEELLGLDVAGWMRQTTVKNLGIQCSAFKDDPEAVQRLGEIIGELEVG